MALFEWNDSFSVKIPSIDVQHKTLVGYINKIHDDMLMGKSIEHLRPVMKGLINYTEEHFKHEEKFFTQYGYPEGPQHTQLHNDLKKQVMDFRDKLEKGEVTISAELLNFLKDWLINHILREDKKYCQYLVQKGAK